MTTTVPSRRRPRGIHRKPGDLQQNPGAKGFTLLEYLEAHEVNALIAAAPNPQARLLILEQWRAGLRVSEALALETRDLYLDTERPTLRVRQDKGRRSRVVPAHPELQAALIAATNFGRVGDGPLIPVARVTAWRWVQKAVGRAGLIVVNQSSLRSSLASMSSWTGAAAAVKPKAASPRKPTFLQRERWKVIQKARRKGMSLRAIERELRINRATVRKYLDAEGPPTRQPRVGPACCLIQKCYRNFSTSGPPRPALIPALQVVPPWARQPWRRPAFWP